MLLHNYPCFFVRFLEMNDNRLLMFSLMGELGLTLSSNVEVMIHVRYVFIEV